MIPERALEIKDELEQIVDVYATLSERKKKLLMELRTIERGFTFKPEFRYVVVAKTMGVRGTFSYRNLNPGDETFRVKRVMVNYSEYESYYDLLKPLNLIDEEVRSVVYYRKFGVLLHCSSGHVLLNDEVLCSDTDWEELLSGNVDKFLK